VRHPLYFAVSLGVVAFSQALAADPKRCIYLDDLGVNLKPAREMGMTTIKVRDAAQALAELEAAVGLPLR